MQQDASRRSGHDASSQSEGFDSACGGALGGCSGALPDGHGWHRSQRRHTRVRINEYIEVAHAFFSDEEPKVVNGILDRLARRLRPTEFEQKQTEEGSAEQ